MRLRPLRTRSGPPEQWIGERQDLVEEVPELGRRRVGETLLATPGSPLLLRGVRVAGEGAVKRSNRDCRYAATRLIDSTRALSSRWRRARLAMSTKSRHRVFAVPRCRAVTIFSARTSSMRYPRMRIGGPPSRRGTAISSGGGQSGSPTLMSTLNWMMDGRGTEPDDTVTVQLGVPDVHLLLEALDA
jgi:hypothetical protein